MEDNLNQANSAHTGKIATTFRALKYPSYRYYWAGQLGHSAAMWMEQVVRPLLIFELTGSALQVGLVVLVRMVPMLVFGLLAGVVADRYNKRRVLIISQFVTLLMHLVLALLLLTNNLAVWHVYATAFISGASMAFNHPARQSMIPRLVPKEMVLNALSLNTAAGNIMRILGASLAGVLMIFFDYGEIYLLNALIFVVVIWTTYKIILVDNKEAIARRTSSLSVTLYADFKDGFRYISHNPVLFYLVGLGMLFFMFGLPYMQVFIPLLAIDVLNIGPSGAGWMLAFTGVGALIGSLTMASLKRLPRRGYILMGLLLLVGASLVLLAQSQWVLLSYLALVIIGGTSMAFTALINSILLEKSSPEYHGRVMSLMSLDRGLVSLGALLAGALAELVGAPLSLTVFAATLMLFTIFTFFGVRSVRQIT